jgi:hypothetical protein
MTSSQKSQLHPCSSYRAALAALVIALIVAAIAFSSGRVSSQESDPQRRDLERVFRKHDRLSLDPGQIARQVKQTRSLTLTTSRGTFEMTLEPHDMRAPGYRAEAWGDNGVRVLERGPVRTYKGTVRGLPAAQARFTIDEGTVEGLIITPGELLFLEPAKRYSATAAKTDFVFYSASDVKEPAGECGNTMAQMVAQHSANVSNQTSAKGPQPEAIFGPALEIALAAEADFEYFSVFGTEAATEAQILTIMNDVEGIYSSQLGLQFSFIATNLRIWSTSGDPYTSPVAPAISVDANTALNEFRTTYNVSPPAGAAGRDIAHLFTGRNIASNNNSLPSTIGIAFQPGLDCPFDTVGFGYGISENISGNRAALTAHEIAHNLNASHVTSAQGSDCGDPGTGTTSIMNPSISPSTNFCQFSRDEITNHAIDTQDCLTPLTQPGCTYSLSQTTQNLASAAGGNTVNVTTQAGCNWAAAEGAGWLSVTGGASGTGSGTVSYSVTANDGICGPRTALISIGGQILTVTQAGKPDYLTDPSTATAIVPGQTINGELSAPDCPTGIVDQGDNPPTIREQAFMDRYKFNGMAGQKIRIEMNAAIPPQSGGLDTYLYLIAPDGNIVNENDDLWLGEQTNSRIPCTNVPTGPCAIEFYPLPQTGTYIIIATSFSSGDSGAYSLTLTSEPLLLTAQVTDSVGSAAALNSVTFVRTSNANHTAFSIVDPHNFSADQTTRLLLFTSDLGLPSQQNPNSSLISVSAGGHPLVVENVGPFTFPGLNGTYIVVALKRSDGGTMPTGSLAFTVTCRSLTSNVTTITIAP